ncbi:hypothetical protein [Nocardioides conyzicola]|uniref:Uncharacterized protein n=1 Tax=Nocardioides conyzicola TaxID=1651781 RepID=A0ABP8WPT3_9ACTN
MFGRTGESRLQREIRVVAELEEWVRAELTRVRAGGRRADATIAVAASAAAETYRVTDHLTEWQNEPSRKWQIHLQHVWKFLAGDRSQHYALSQAIAEYLLSPLNHNEGEDGPDDFDRPQTVAAYSAALAAVAWGVDFAVTAVSQIFEAIDLKYEGDVEQDERWGEVQREIEFVRRVVTAVVGYEPQTGQGFTPDFLASIRS